MNEKNNKRLWIPAKERKWVFLFIVLTVVWVLYGLWGMYNVAWIDLHSRDFKESFKNYGSIARLILFAVLAYYVLSVIVRKRWADHWVSIKKVVIALLKMTRKLHTPLAIVAIGLIVLHAIGAFLYGYKWDFTNVSGVLAAIVLIGVPIAGVLRYRKLDRKWHLRLGLAFAILFLIHAYF
ncbi:hypothetical protein [Cohnella silvisoli]|uniref:Ferric oxidoreductase domain-containing protein n=1 Tax=Cohnella silvisoli TaxID=2873699 RepID=A0ABV1L0Y8_9BACL|nr:hypothetical protein [Cohnella silvisoli]MCD9025380.1 hypothetical protein [Cohnella silvisoli]